MKYILTLTVCALIGACGAVPQNEIAATIAHKENANRFSVQMVSQFADSNAYNGYRGIWVIRDLSTGRDYIGVTGIGISEVATHSEASVDGEGNVTSETVKHEQ